MSWLKEYHLHLQIGDLKSAYQVRRMAVEKAANERNMKALIEVGDYRVKTKDKNIQYVISLFKGCPIEKGGAFGGYIKGQDIAVVGPAKINQNPDTGNRRVMRFNCREDNADFSYYNGEGALNALENKSFPDLDWVIFKAAAHHERYTKEIGNTESRYLTKYDKVNFNGQHYMMPVALMDLLGFSPRSVKIYNADLMLTVDRHKKYYPKEFEREDKVVEVFKKCTLLNYDPVTHYVTLKKLWDNGLIEGDERFNEVMIMGTEEYINQLQKAYYGNFGSNTSKV